MKYYKVFIQGGHESVAGVCEVLVYDGVEFFYQKNSMGQSVIIINESETHKLPTDAKGFYLPSMGDSGYSMTELNKNSLDFLIQMGFNIPKDEL